VFGSVHYTEKNVNLDESVKQKLEVNAKLFKECLCPDTHICIYVHTRQPKVQKGLGSNRSHDVSGKANCSHPSCLCSPSSETGGSPLKGCDGNCRPGGKPASLQPGL